jgi:hypothetical protein
MGACARRVCEWFAKIRSKALHFCGFLLSFIFAMSLCLIHFDTDRPSRLQDVVILDKSSL